MFINCINNAKVTGVRKTGGFCGTANNVTYSNCVNNGTVTCLGTAKEEEIVAWNVKDNVATTKITTDTSKEGGSSGYYRAAAGSVCNGSCPSYSENEGFTNNGAVIIGTKEFKDTNGKFWINR